MKNLVFTKTVNKRILYRIKQFIKEESDPKMKKTIRIFFSIVKILIDTTFTFEEILNMNELELLSVESKGKHFLLKVGNWKSIDGEKINRSFMDYFFNKIINKTKESYGNVYISNVSPRILTESEIELYYSICENAYNDPYRSPQQKIGFINSHLIAYLMMEHGIEFQEIYMIVFDDINEKSCEINVGKRTIIVDKFFFDRVKTMHSIKEINNERVFSLTRSVSNKSSFYAWTSKVLKIMEIEGGIKIFRNTWYFHRIRAGWKLTDFYKIKKPHQHYFDNIIFARYLPYNQIDYSSQCDFFSDFIVGPATP